MLGGGDPVRVDRLDVVGVGLAAPADQEALGDRRRLVDLALRDGRAAGAARGLRDERERHHRGAREVVARLGVVDVDQRPEAPLRARASPARPATSTRGSPERTASGCGSAGGSPGSSVPSTSRPQTCSNGTWPDELLDVDAAVAQGAALAVGLGDLGGEGDDALEAGLDFAHDAEPTAGAAACAPDGRSVRVLTSWTRSPSCRRPRSPRASATAPSRPVRWSRPASGGSRRSIRSSARSSSSTRERALAEADAIGARRPAGVRRRADRGQGQHARRRLVHELRLALPVAAPADAQRLPRAAAARRRVRRARHDEPARVRDPADDRAAPQRADAQPVGHHAHARRLLRRLGGGGRGGPRPDRARQRRRRLAADPRRLLRPRRPEAEPRPDLARARPRRLLPRRGRRADAHGDRDGAAARRAVRLRGRATRPGPRSPPSRTRSRCGATRGGCGSR